jgi:hypothetical protein
MRCIGILTLIVAAMSCASSFAQNLPANAPQTDYRNFTCDELVREGRSLSRRGFLLSGLKAGPGGTDGTRTTSAIVMVWPATVVDDKQRSRDLALASKQMESIEEASIRGQCSVQFQRPPAG